MNKENHFPTSAFTTALGLAFLLGISSENQLVHASPCAVSAATLLSAPVVATQASHPTAKKQSDRLLQLARQSMRAGDLQRAEWYLRQAQELGVSYNGLLDRLSDTPAKLQKDLDQLKRTSGSPPASPSQFYSPAVPSGAASPQVPPSAMAGGSGVAATTTPWGQDPGTRTAGSPADPLDGLVDGAKQQATKFLNRGRQSLGQGDTTAALGWYHRARNLDVSYREGEFSPADLAHALVRSGVDPQRLASAPAGLPPGPTPDQMMNLGDGIPPAVAQAMHREPATNAAQLQQPLGIRKIGKPVDLEQVPQKESAWAAKKQEVLKLLALARAALDRGDWQQAESMTDYAERLEVPDSEYQSGEMRPWVLTLEIDRRKAQIASNSPAPSHPSAKERAPSPSVADKRQPLVASPHQLEKERLPAESANNSARLVQALQSGDPRSLQILDAELKADRGLAASSDLDMTEPIPPSIDQLLDASPFDAAGDILEAPTPLAAPRTEAVSGSSNAAPAPSLAMPESSSNQAADRFQRGENALRAGDSQAARKWLLEAYQDRDQLTEENQQRLQDYLSVLGSKARLAKSSGPAIATVSDTQTEDRAALQDFYRRVTKEMVSIGRLKEEEPGQAWEQLKSLRGRVADAAIAEDARRQLLSRVDRSLEEMEKYVAQNKPIIELENRNRQMLEEVDQRRKHRLYVQQELAKLVDQFNTLMDEQRYPEAFVIAKQARELDPTNPVVENLAWKSQFARQMTSGYHRQQEYQRNAMGAFDSVEGSSVPFNDNEVLSFGQPKYWEELTARRQKMLREQQSRYSTAELQIQQSLKKKVDVSFSDTSLTSVMDTLGRLAGINIFLDPQGMSAEGISTDERIDIQLRDAVSLESALNLILRPLRLSYIIEDEVLRITSETVREKDVLPQTYNVADLVIPIPSFNPSSHVGLAAAIRDAYQSQSSLGLTGQFMAKNQNQEVPLTLAAETSGGASNQSALAQLGASGQIPMMGGGGQTPFGVGATGQGGGAQADFDTLIELITTTIEPTTWDEVGGTGSIAPFPTNLSIVVSQTQEVHEKVADLLEQLRRLQDLQVTIEVRFITLNDNFFERIGIDFDFDIDDNTGLSPVDIATADDEGPSITVGLDPSGAPTLDLDIPFTQDHFGAAVPSFGGFDPASAANFGFAILSDIEAFFVIQAAQGDRRTNILQAPKVTLFNGQNAVVSDTSQRPFVTTVIPVVGDFAAAHQPIITVLTEGTSLSVQAVVSPDRRFVRLTMVPFFSRIGDVDTFTFNGRTSSNSGTIAIDPADDGNAVANEEETVVEGTTVQLPTFSFTTVTTTVSVPDGGTILLGGIKRLSEGRNEQGVPMLSKLPYINRLFKNVGIGRETQSLMMMVTPRIIIQEEEEDKLGINLP